MSILFAHLTPVSFYRVIPYAVLRSSCRCLRLFSIILFHGHSLFLYAPFSW